MVRIQIVPKNAATAAKSLQSCPTLCHPIDRQPTRLPSPWDSPGKNTGVGCHFLLQCMKVKSESEVAQSVRLLASPWTAAYQAPPSMGFSRQEYWSGVPLPSPSEQIRVSQRVSTRSSKEIKYPLQNKHFRNKGCEAEDQSERQSCWNR